MEWCTLQYSLALLLSLSTCADCGISYQSVSFVHHTPVLKPIRRPPLITLPSNYQSTLHLPLQYYNSEPEEVWPSSLFDDSESIFDVTLTPNGHPELPTHDFINDLELTPDPYLLTGYRAKQVANFIYGRGELFYDDIPHAKALIKLQNKRVQNGLRPNRLGSINPRSPFYREKLRYQF